MTAWDDILAPAPVYCDGCGEPIETGAAMRVERLKTPLGSCTRRSHDNRRCPYMARATVNGTPMVEQETAQDKVNARLRGE